MTFYFESLTKSFHSISSFIDTTEMSSVTVVKVTFRSFSLLQEELPKDVFRLDQATINEEQNRTLQLRFTQKEVRGKK